jgi:hypothetical protein
LQEAAEARRAAILEANWRNEHNRLAFAYTGDRTLTPEEIQVLMAQYPGHPGLDPGGDGQHEMD